MIKRVLLMLLWVAGANGANAQGEPFEGEIVMEQFVQVPKSMSNYQWTGVHIIRSIRKGGKVHDIDETTGYHTIANSRTGEKIEFLPSAKMGILYSAPVPSSTTETKTNDVEKKDDRKDILGHNCTLYKGKIVTIHKFQIEGDNKTWKSTEEIQAYCADDLIDNHKQFPDTDIRNIPLKYIKKDNYGTIGNREMVIYQEVDVVKITPRKVDDEEFEIPSTYDILEYDVSNSSFKDAIRYKKFMKEMEKCKGADDSKKSTGVHYRTGGEWKF